MIMLCLAASFTVYCTKKHVKRIKLVPFIATGLLLPPVYDIELTHILQGRCWVLLNKAVVRQVLLYGIIGCTSALFDFLLFALMHQVMGMNEYLANIFSIHAGIALSFTLNRKFNFKKTDKTLFRAIPFYLTGLFGLLLSQGLLWLGSTLLLPTLLTKLFSILIVGATQFTINKFVSFR